MGLLFASTHEDAVTRHSRTPQPRPVGAKAARITVPNPYALSSSESEDELEPDLDEVATVRRSLARPAPIRAATSERSKKGWIAHHSVFPNSSSSSSSDNGEDSEKQTESETEDERSVMMGRSKRKAKARARDTNSPDGDLAGYAVSPSAGFGSSEAPETDYDNDLEEPLLGPDDLEGRGGSKMTIPNRLQVYHGRFGHWEREGLRKYKGKLDTSFDQGAS
jgi:hypothetical protein